LWRLCCWLAVLEKEVIVCGGCVVGGEGSGFSRKTWWVGMVVVVEEEPDGGGGDGDVERDAGVSGGVGGK
jgi:hypothetical protein